MKLGTIQEIIEVVVNIGIVLLISQIIYLGLIVA